MTSTVLKASIKRRSHHAEQGQDAASRHLLSYILQRSCRRPFGANIVSLIAPTHFILTRHTFAFHRKSVVVERGGYPPSLRRAPLSGTPDISLSICFRKILPYAVCRSSSVPSTAQTMLLDNAESHSGRDHSKGTRNMQQLGMYLVIRLDVQFDFLAGKGTDSKVNHRLA